MDHVLVQVSNFYPARPWVTYSILYSYLDRNAITVARLDGMEDELNMTSTEYQTCVSILFVGYILGQIPSSNITFACCELTRRVLTDC